MDLQIDKRGLVDTGERRRDLSDPKVVAEVDHAEIVTPVLAQLDAARAALAEWQGGALLPESLETVMGLQNALGTVWLYADTQALKAEEAAQEASRIAYEAQQEARRLEEAAQLLAAQEAAALEEGA